MIKTLSKIKFYTISIRRNSISIIFILFTISLVIFSKSNLEAAKSGLMLWANNVVPSLFPFFIATELLSHTNIVNILGKYLNKFMRPIFNVPGEGAFAFIMGIISGYPTGAKIVVNLRENKMCTKEESERLLAFTNNSGPLFILGTIGISLFGNTTIGILLLITHILSCFTVGFIFRFWKRDSSTNYKSNFKDFDSSKLIKVNFSNLGEILSISIKNSISTIFLIGGFVVLFSVIISILNKTHIIEIISTLIKPFFNFIGINCNFSAGIINGFVELTNGIKEISNIPCKNISINIILCSFILGFGGISVLLQVFSIISKTDISIFPYFIGKLLQGIIAALYTYILISNFIIFNFNLIV